MKCFGDNIQQKVKDTRQKPQSEKMYYYSVTVHVNYVEVGLNPTCKNSNLFNFLQTFIETLVKFLRREVWNVKNF